MNRVFLLLISSLLLLTGCKSKPKPKPNQATGQATLIGIIEMVNPEQNYVLVRCEPMPALAAGTELIALSSTGTKSKLVLTPERKGHYITADIKEGQPEVHHLVLVQRGESTASTAMPAAPAAPPPVTPSSASGAPYPSMPFLPGIIPPGTGGGAELPLQPFTPSQPPIPTPAPDSPATAAPGLGGLEPPVGNP